MNAIRMVCPVPSQQKTSTVNANVEGGEGLTARKSFGRHVQELNFICLVGGSVDEHGTRPISGNGLLNRQQHGKCRSAET